MPNILLRPYLLTFKNRSLARDGEVHHRHRDLILIGIAIVVMTCIYTGLILAFRSMEGNPFFATIIPTKIIELACYTFLILLTISNTIALIGNMYVAEKVNLLLTSPVSSFRLYVTKIIEAVFETCAMLLIFLMPAVLAYYVTFDLGVGFLLSGMAVALPFIGITVGLATVLATVFVNFISFFWRRGLLFLICFMSFAIIALVRMLHFLTQLKLERSGSLSMVEFIGLFDNPNPVWLPSRWMADILSSHLGAPGDDLAIKYLLLVATACGFLALGYAIFDCCLLTVRSSATTLQHRTPARAESSRDIVRELLESLYYSLPLEQQSRAMILKDLSSLIRDQGQAAQLLLYLGIGSIYVVVFKFMSSAMVLGSVAQEVWLGFLASINILFAGFVLTALMTRLVYPSVSLEGKAFWLLQITPVGLPKFIRTKFWCWLPLTAGITISLELAGALAIGLPFPVIISTAVIALFSSVGFTGLAVGIGAIFASFDWESPSQISVGLGTLVLLLAGLTLVVILGVPTSAATFLITVPATRGALGDLQWFGAAAFCLFLVMAINLLVAQWACTRGAGQLQAITMK